MSLKEYPMEHTRMEDEDDTENKVDTPNEDNEDIKTTEDKDKMTPKDICNLKSKRPNSTTRRYKLLRFDLDTQWNQWL